MVFNRLFKTLNIARISFPPQITRMENPASITCLPDEILTFILLNNEPWDIINFGATCKQLHQFVLSNDYLWRKKFSETLPSVLVKFVIERKDGKWQRELLNFYNVRTRVHKELLKMPSKYYWRVEDHYVSDPGEIVTFQNVKVFFSIATEDNLTYFYLIHILQEFVRKGNAIIDKNQCLKPLYTLSTIHYAQLVLEHIIHAFLILKWLQKYIRSECTPVYVITFFLQWIDVTKIYSDEYIEKKIPSLVMKVEAILEEQKTGSKPNLFTQQTNHNERQVLNAISKVIYSNNNVYNALGAKTADILRVFEENDGYFMICSAIYQAVAKRFGLNCDLILCYDELFLDWKRGDDPNQLYTIDPTNGDIKPKETSFCGTDDRLYKYRPDYFLDRLRYLYLNDWGTKDRKTINASRLYGAFQMSETSPGFLDVRPALEDSPALNSTLHLIYLEDEHLQLISKDLADLTCVSSKSKYINRDHRRIQRRHKAVKYPVGILCYNNVHNYVGVIYGWEVDGNHNDWSQFHYFWETRDVEGADQPVYYVVASGQPDRVFLEDTLTPVAVPYRLQNVEDRLARDFTHFDGFSYVPNEQKLLEYPDEQQYIEAYKKTLIRS